MTLNKNPSQDANYFSNQHTVNLIPVFLLIFYFSVNVFVFIRAKSFTYRYKLIRILVLSVHGLLLLFAACVWLLAGKPHLSHQMFSFYFQVNFVFLLAFIVIFIAFIFYGLADLIIISFLRKIRQGTKIRIRNIAHKTALIIVVFLWAVMFYGYFYGATNFKVKTYQLSFPSLPESFAGTRILHFSDTHLGSFCKSISVEKGIRLIREQNADIMMFTGDLVNISAEEAIPYVEMFASLEAPMGKFAVLGNHDMSDYMKLDIDRDSMNVNTQAIAEILKKMGFVVLRDTVVFISNGKDSIQIAGTDNWGKPPFKAYSQPEKVFQQLQPHMFTILLSHDPSFWDTHIKGQHDIGLTLSGHTHGAQAGFRLKNRQWSPASLKYKTWAGLYMHENNILHVNPGFGFIGMPFRIGINPEITILITEN